MSLSFAPAKADQEAIAQYIERFPPPFDNFTTAHAEVKYLADNRSSLTQKEKYYKPHHVGQIAWLLNYPDPSIIQSIIDGTIFWPTLGLKDARLMRAWKNLSIFMDAHAASGQIDGLLNSWYHLKSKRNNPCVIQATSALPPPVTQIISHLTLQELNTAVDLAPPVFGTRKYWDVLPAPPILISVMRSDPALANLPTLQDFCTRYTHAITLPAHAAALAANPYLTDHGRDFLRSLCLAYIADHDGPYAKTAGVLRQALLQNGLPITPSERSFLIATLTGAPRAAVMSALVSTPVYMADSELLHAVLKHPNFTLRPHAIELFAATSKKDLVSLLLKVAHKFPPFDGEYLPPLDALVPSLESLTADDLQGVQFIKDDKTISVKDSPNIWSPFLTQPNPEIRLAAISMLSTVYPARALGSPLLQPKSPKI